MLAPPAISAKKKLVWVKRKNAEISHFTVPVAQNPLKKFQRVTILLVILRHKGGSIFATSATSVMIIVSKTAPKEDTLMREV